MMMSLDEAIKYCDEEAEEQQKMGERNSDDYLLECASVHRQLAEWLRELKTYREFADWLVEAVIGEDWEESADFYAEVLCRKLTKLGHLKVEDGKYVAVNADEDSD